MGAMNNVIRFMFCIALCLLGSKVFASSGQCTMVSGNPMLAINMGDKTITDANNVAGNSVDPFTAWSASNDYTLSCDCNSAAMDSGSWVFTTTTPLTNSGNNWFQLNDFLDIKLRVTIRGEQLTEIPFDGISTVSDSRKDLCTPGGLHLSGTTPSGHSGNIAIKIRKPIIGTMTIPQTLVAELWECYHTPSSGVCSASGPSILKYYVSGTISAPEECVLAGASNELNISTGIYNINSFKIKGQSANNPSVKTKTTFTLKCSSGVEATANLKLTLSATPDADYPAAIKSTMAGIGYVVYDDKLNPINPAGGLFPAVTLNDHQAQVSFYAEPVSTTGIAPATVGPVESTGYIRVDYD
ncbi:fimbrial protein [Citrobacter portucalensis]|uniref:fimbrial protein n=1 Tax=Citrobacter portucalensis TaxID=1639133 RepID=UPI00351CD876